MRAGRSLSEKRILGWAAYDWANSAFATTVMAGFFPVFFKNYLCGDAPASVSTARLGLGNSLGSLCVALMAPLLGALSDRGPRKKAFLLFLAYMGACATAGLSLLTEGAYVAALILYGLGLIGFSGSNIFYDALLPRIAPAGRLDAVSALGYAMGYLGGGLLFLLNVAMVTWPGSFGLSGKAAAVRLSFLTVALWWGGWSLCTAFWVREDSARQGMNLKESFLMLWRTVRRLRHLKTLSVFLLAYWLYMDGVDTVVRMAVDYGLSLGFGEVDLVTALLITQFVGFPAALLFGKFGEKFGTRRAIFVALGVYVGVTVWGVLMKRRYEFYVLAVAIGCVQGGVQALSRSLYARLIPRGREGEFYGLYNMLGKFAAIVGPACVGGVTLLAEGFIGREPAAQGGASGHLASRIGIASLVVLFVAGGVLLGRVREERGREEAARFLSGK